jgi:hypothetical protein
MERPPASWLLGGVSIGVGGRPPWPCDEGGDDPSDEGRWHWWRRLRAVPLDELEGGGAVGGRGGAVGRRKP